LVEALGAALVSALLFRCAKQAVRRQVVAESKRKHDHLPSRAAGEDGNIQPKLRLIRIVRIRIRTVRTYSLEEKIMFLDKMQGSGTFGAGNDPAYFSGTGQLKVLVVPGTWNVASPYFGDWNTAGNWVGGMVPNGIGKIATFDNTVAGPTAAITNVPVVVGVLNIVGSSRVDITGVDQGTLTMQAAPTGNTAQINISGGTLGKLNLPLSFNSPTAISVAAGSTLEIGNPVNLNGQTVTMSGGGTLQFDVNFSLSGGTLQANAGAVALGAEAAVSPVLLDIAGNSQLSGAGTIGGDVTYGSSAASLFAGGIVGAGSSLVLSGGSLTLTGDNTYGGGTEVLGGTLIAAGDQSLPDGGSLTVGAEAASIFGASSLAVSPAAAAVPEPSAIALLGVGACALIAYRWRRRGPAA
jgi:autotransporter-associated beta strand protein